MYNLGSTSYDVSLLGLHPIVGGHINDRRAEGADADP